MERELIQGLYQFEWELRDRLTAWLQVPLGVGTALTGGLVALAASFDYGWSFLTALFLIGLSIALVALVDTAKLILSSFHGYRYEKLPNASAIREHYIQLKAYHESLGTSDQLAVEFADFLDRRMVEATTQNSANNIRKADLLHQATVSLIATSVGLALASTSYVIQKAIADTPPTRVILIESPSATDAKGATESTAASAGPAEPRNEPIIEEYVPKLRRD